jgi:hypothetical protein
MALQFLYDGYFAGTVGIGTDSPDYLLDLYQSTATTSTATGTTLQRLWNYVGGDLKQQKTFIDFVFQDDNDNEYPQVRIGAEVGQNGDANSQEKEGSGAFVVYTNNATGVGPGTPTGLEERFRVDYQGNVGIGTTSPGTTRLNVVSDNNSNNNIIEAYALNLSQGIGLTYNGLKATGSNSDVDIVITPKGTGNTRFDAGNIKIQSAVLSNQQNTNVDTGTEAIASVVLATYTAAFFDFVIKKGTNVRSGTVYACHDGTSVAFTETSTQDLGDTSDVTLNVVISTIYLQLQATTTSDDWSIKSLIRAI